MKFISESDILFKYTKCEKDNWMGWRDYISEELNPNYPYYLRHSVHLPRIIIPESKNAEHNQVLIYVHRYYRGIVEYDYGKTIYSEERLGESKCVFRGHIGSMEELYLVLSKYLKISN